MRSKAGDIYCERGETFTVGFDIRGNNNAPYCLSMNLDDEAKGTKSYLLLTVASSDDVTGENRYIANFWGDTSRFDKFYSTQPSEVSTRDANSLWSLIESRLNALGNPTGVTPANYSLYYTVTGDGTRTYFKLNGTEGNASIADYTFKYIKHFPKEITEQWVEQRYNYSLKLVAGRIIADANSDGRPIIVDESYPLIAPHSIYIGSNIRGSINAVDNSINYKEA